MRPITHYPFSVATTAILAIGGICCVTSLAFALREVFRREGGTSNRLKMKHFGLSLEKAYNALPLLLMFLGQAFYIPHSVMIFLLPYLKLEELNLVTQLKICWAVFYFLAFVVQLSQFAMRYIKMANMTSTVLLGKSHNYAIYTYLVFTTGLMAAGMWGASFVSYDTTKLSLVGLALFWTAITNGIMCFQLVVKTLNSLKQDVRLENEINGRSTCNIEVQVRRSKLFLMIAFGSLVAFDFACVITFCIVANLSINNGLAFDKLQDIFSAVVALGSIHVLISSLLMDSFRNKLRQTLIDRVNTKAVLEGAGVSKSVVGGGVGLVGGRSTSTNSLNENNSGSKNGTIKLPRSSSHKAALGGSKLVASTSMNNVVRPSIQHPATINTNNPPLYPWDA